MNAILQVENLTKQYADFKLDHVSFSVPKGTIMGLIGENGAGKSTTINAILDLIHKDDGTVTFWGQELSSTKQIKEDVGVVFDGINFYETLTPAKVGKIAGAAYKQWDGHLFQDYLKRFQLPADKEIKSLSKGMKMKLCIAVALSHNPKLLILDEATSGLDPVKIWIEDDYVRAVRGGIGEAKTGGNYVASLAAQVKAHDEGYSQVLWLDGVERKYIEEVGAMNIFFKINGTVVTPMLNGSILPGVTRASCIDLCKHWGLPVEERRISVDELVEAARTGALEECWGSGTAAVISPVGALRYENEVMQIKDGGIGEFSQKLYDTVTGIQTGKVEDTLGWTVEVTPLEK